MALANTSTSNMSYLIKLMLLACFMLPTASFSNSEYITATGFGKTEQEAKQSAFVKAIEEKVGVMTLSDRETKKLVQTKNDIYAYSAGYVSDYKIISTNVTNDGVYVTVDVKVNSSKIKNRILLDNSKPAEISGSTASATFSTYKNTKTNADSLLKKVLLNYPKNAYKTTINSSKVKSSVDRNFAIEIDIGITLDDDFVNTLEETAAYVENNKGNYTGKLIIDKQRFTAILDSRSSYMIEDVATMEMIYQTLVPKNARMKISFEDNDKSLYSVCRAVDTFVKIDSNNVTFYRGKKALYSIEITDKGLYNVINDVTQIKTSMVDVKECQK